MQDIYGDHMFLVRFLYIPAGAKRELNCMFCFISDFGALFDPDILCREITQALFPNDMSMAAKYETSSSILIANDHLTLIFAAAKD